MGSLNHCRFDDNTASAWGGAVSMSESTVSINNCDFTGNTATAEGGAVRAMSSSITTDQSTFTDNEARNGGTCHLLNSDWTETYSLHENNYAYDDGGAANVQTTETGHLFSVQGAPTWHRAGEAGSALTVGDDVDFDLDSAVLHANLTYDPDPLTAGQLVFGSDNVILIDRTASPEASSASAAVPGRRQLHDGPVLERLGQRRRRLCGGIDAAARIELQHLPRSPLLRPRQRRADRPVGFPAPGDQQRMRISIGPGVRAATPPRPSNRRRRRTPCR